MLKKIILEILKEGFDWGEYYILHKCIYRAETAIETDKYADIVVQPEEFAKNIADTVIQKLKDSEMEDEIKDLISNHLMVNTGIEVEKVVIGSEKLSKEILKIILED